MTTSIPSLSFPNDKISISLKPADKIILGLSGGPDSVYLLYQILATLSPDQIIAAHVNYHLRNRDSDLDQQFVEKLCREKGIVLEILEIHNLGKKAAQEPTKGNLEETCRDLRYDYFENLRKIHRAKLIVVGHHLNDQLETFLLNLARGSSLRGFGAMRPYDAKRKLYRPLLAIPKQTILAFLRQNKIPYRLDRTNLSPLLRRNRIRLHVIPELEKINPGFLKTAGQAIADLQANLDLIEKHSTSWIAQNVQNTPPRIITPDHIIAYFEQQQFLSEPPVSQKNIIRSLFQHYYKKSLTAATITEILSTLAKRKSGLSKEFGPRHNLKIIKDDKTGKRLVVIANKFD